MKRALLLIVMCCSLQAFAGTGRIIIVNTDKAGQGFNDTTPATPVGGNPGTTLGAQRLAVFEAAAARWQNLIDTNVDVIVNATFAPIAGCTETEGVLGQASPVVWKHSFVNAPKENVWYPIALANKFAGVDLEPQRADIFTQFNASVDDATCLGASNWYYGLDGNHGDHSDLYVVVLHELAHGLGISGAASAPGFREGRPSVSDTLTYDESLGLRWEQMSDVQRSVSVTNTGNLTWDGPNVRTIAPRMLTAITTLTVTEPALIARNYDIGTASFGVPVNVATMSGRLVGADDAANVDGPSTVDGCTAYSNAGAVAGKVAVVDRGTCTFVVKARNAQAAGAIGLVVIDNRRDTCTPPGMGNTDDASDVTIPVISISASDGDALRPQLGNTVNGTLRIDPTQLAGAAKSGRVRLYAPCTIQGGSSTHHWDVVATPNLLMEPSISSDLSHGVDLTLYQLLDIGWTAQPFTGRRLLKR
ncbi:MAG TPA: PA domain-containing protein [Thermoanaerobaculia bacterium]